MAQSGRECDGDSSRPQPLFGALKKMNVDSQFSTNEVGYLEEIDSGFLLVQKKQGYGAAFATSELFVDGVPTDTSVFYRQNKSKKKVFFDSRRLLKQHGPTKARYAALYCWVGRKPSLQTLAQYYCPEAFGSSVELKPHVGYLGYVTFTPSPLFCIAKVYAEESPVCVVVPATSLVRGDCDHDNKSSIDEYIKSSLRVYVQCRKVGDGYYATSCGIQTKVKNLVYVGTK